MGTVQSWVAASHMHHTSAHFIIWATWVESVNALCCLIVSLRCTVVLSLLWQATKELGPPPAPPAAPQGLYVYGSVGSGKSLLMDMFYDTARQQLQLEHSRRCALRVAKGEAAVGCRWTLPLLFCMREHACDQQVLCVVSSCRTCGTQVS